MLDRQSGGTRSRASIFVEDHAPGLHRAIQAANTLAASADEEERILAIEQEAEKVLRFLIESHRQALSRKADVDSLEAARRGIARYGTPPPGEGRHPLQSHRDSMG